MSISLKITCTADFYLNLKWYDLRIDFRDLNTVTSLNTLSRTDQEAIWTPKLGFTNALGPYQVRRHSTTTWTEFGHFAMPAWTVFIP